MGRKRAGQSRAVQKTVAGRFGRRLEQLATAAGLTTAEFARKAGVTEDAIRKYYRGTDTPASTTLERRQGNDGKARKRVDQPVVGSHEITSLVFRKRDV